MFEGQEHDICQRPWGNILEEVVFSLKSKGTDKCKLGEGSRGKIMDRKHHVQRSCGTEKQI